MLWMVVIVAAGGVFLAGMLAGLVIADLDDQPEASQLEGFPAPAQASMVRLLPAPEPPPFDWADDEVLA